MKKILLLALPIMVMCAVSCEKKNNSDGTPVIQFKDPNFLEALKSRGVDKNRDGQISRSEAASFDDGVILDISGCGIRHMDEIKFFRSLRRLDCSDNQLTSLDVSNCTALTELHCYTNKLTSLDLNTALKYLFCSANQLTSLDLSNNTALRSLNCDANQLTSLDVSNCTALDNLLCHENHLTSLDLSNCTALITLWCYENHLTSLDLSDNTALGYLRCYTNPITSLDVSMCQDLTELWCIDYITNGIDYKSVCPLESLRILKYNRIDDDDMRVLEAVYGDIIEYIE